MTMRASLQVMLGLSLFICLLPSSSAEAEIVEYGSLDIYMLAPVAMAIIGAGILWKWILPISLGNLQVAFEIDDDLYEVHRLSKSRRDTKELLNLPSVPFGVLSYLMAMGGIMLIVAELLI